MSRRFKVTFVVEVAAGGFKSAVEAAREAIAHPHMPGVVHRDVYRILANGGHAPRSQNRKKSTNGS